jgi:ribosomal subunit interface protein
MPASVQVTFRDFAPSQAVRDHVEKRAAKLDALYDRVLDCRIVLEEPHRHSKTGKKFHVRIDMRVPGKELVVSRNEEDLKEDLYATLDGAFNDAERVLEDHARRLQPSSPNTVGPPHGVVARIFHDRDYGFIEAEGDGHDVYFHRNSVVDGAFDKITPGTKVRFAEEDGDKGPQASTVHVSGTS